MDLRVVLERDAQTGDWAAWCPELPGCASANTAEEEALTSVLEASALCLEPGPMDLPDDAVLRRVAL